MSIRRIRREGTALVLALACSLGLPAVGVGQEAEGPPESGDRSPGASESSSPGSPDETNEEGSDAASATTSRGADAAEPPAESGSKSTPSNPPNASDEPGTTDDASDSRDTKRGNERPQASRNSGGSDWNPPDDPRFAQFDCPPKDRTREYYYICVDTYRGRILYHAMFPKNQRIIRPNRPILIKVHHRIDYRISIESIGETGIHVPGVDRRGFAKPGDEPGTRGEREEEEPTETMTTSKVLPAQLPGASGVRIELIDRDTGSVADELTTEYIVEKTYAGGLRIGVGMIFAGALDGNYAIRKAPGARQPEIVGNPPGFANMELVLGYAAFLDRKGRPARGCRTRPWCFAPYFGVGLISQTPQADVKFLSSLYLGLEIEPVRNFTLAAALVGRRATRLRQGLEVGDPIEPGSDITTNDYTLGAGFVLNVAPDLFKFAAGSATSTFTSR